MNEEHIIAAILTSGLLAKSGDEKLEPNDVIALYNNVLASYLSSIRPTK